MNSKFTTLENGAVVGGALQSSTELERILHLLGIHERTREEREAELMAAFGTE